MPKKNAFPQKKNLTVRKKNVPREKSCGMLKIVLSPYRENIFWTSEIIPVMVCSNLGKQRFEIHSVENLSFKTE